MSIEIRPKEDGKFDEVVARDVFYLHIETMAKGHLWLGFDCDGKAWHLDVFIKKGKLAYHFRDDGPAQQ